MAEREAIAPGRRLWTSKWDAARLNFWMGVVLLVLAAIRFGQEPNEVPTVLLVLGLCNLTIGLAARKRENG